MHWRLQRILHSLSHLKHALTDPYPPGAGDHLFTNPMGLGISLGFRVENLPGGVLQFTKGRENYILRPQGSDGAVFHEIFVRGEYKELIHFLKLNDLSVHTLVDAGANIGLAARYFYEQLRPGKILCIEPFPPNFEVACKNLEGLEEVQLLNKAIWSRPLEQLHLHRHFRDGQDWAMSASEKAGSLGAGTAQAISLNEVVKMPGFQSIDLLKVDIEGAEFEIFDPAADTTFLECVKVVCIEVHREVLGYKKIFETFKRHGFVLMESGRLMIGVRV